MTRQPTAEDRAALTALITATAQLTAFCSTRAEEADLKVAKRAGLREHARIPRRRHVLTDPRQRLAKLSIETGFDIRRNTFLLGPLEPWDVPQPGLAMSRYRKIMNSQTGADLLESFDDEIALTHLEWMCDQQILAVDPDDPRRVVPLSDSQGPTSRTYPGAPVPDADAFIGSTLRGHADGLILAAHLNASLGRKTGRRGTGKLGKIVSGGIEIPAKDLCAEANRLKDKRAELDGYRYMSIDTARRAIKRLLAAGLLREVRPPRAVREGRTWKTIPRVLALSLPTPGSATAPPPPEPAALPPPTR